MPKKSNMESLTPKQQAFCHKLIELDWNQTNAAIAAGYSPKSAATTASRMLKNDKVVRYLDECVDKSLGAMKSQIRHKVLSELIPIATSDITDIVNVRTEEYEENIRDIDGNIIDTVTKTRQIVEIADTKNLTTEQRRGIASIKQDAKGAIEIKFHDKKSALELLGRHGGLWTDKQEITVKGKLETENKTINYTDLPPEEAKKLFFDKISGADNNGD